MNERQRKVLIYVAVILVITLLYPPFHKKLSEGRVIGAGYSFLFDPPYLATVDAVTLITQWIGVLIIGGIVFLLAKDK